MTHISPLPARHVRGMVLALAGSLAWCALAATAVAAPLVLAVSRTPLCLPLYVAQENGYFSAEGLDVKLADCVGGHRCLRMVLDGQADVATASELPVVMNSFSSANMAVLATFARSAEDVKLITHARAAIRLPKDLAGKRVGTTPGTASQYFLELYLLTVGVDPRSLTVVPLQPEETVAALQAGKVDAIAVWQPYGFQALKALGAQASVLPANNAYLQTFNLVAHRKLAGVRDADLARLLRAVERAERHIQEHPAEAKALLARRLATTPQFVDAVWPGLRFRLGLEPSLLATMEGEARWATREGHAQGALKPDFLQLLYAAPLKSVKPDAVALSR